MVFNPNLESGIRPEQPIERPSGLQALADLGSLFLNAQASKPKARELTQSERDNLALQPFAERLADLADATPVGQRGNIARQVQSEYTAFIRQNPTLADDAAGLMKTVVGIETTPVETSGQDAVVAARTKWIQETPEGQMAAVSGVVIGSDGQIDQEATNENVNASFLSSQAEEAKLAQTKRQLAQSEGNVSLWKSQTSEAMKDYLPAWQQESEQFVSSLAKLISQGDERFDTWEEQVAALREYERVTKGSFRSRALQAGMNQEIFEASIGQATAPITDAIGIMEKFSGDQEAGLKLIKTLSEKNAITGMTKTFGALAGLPEFQNEFGRMAANRQLVDQGQWTQVFEYFDGLAATGIKSPLDLFSNIPSSTEEAVGATSISNPEVVSQLRTKGQDEVLSTVTEAGKALGSFAIKNIASAEGQQGILIHLGAIVNGADALDKPLSAGKIGEIFSPTAVRTLASLAAQSSQAGQDVKNTVVSFVSTQARRNEAEINNIIAGLPEGFAVTYNNGQAIFAVDQKTFLGSEEGVNFASWYEANKMERDYGPLEGLSQENLLTAVGRYSRQWRNNVASMDKNIQSYNQLNQSVRRIVPELDGLLFSRDRGQETQPEGRIGRAKVALTNLIDKTEGAGDYSTLFGHSQRASGPFAGVDVSKMTLGQLKDFADPSGEYGQWVKGQVGRVATPMGRYQFVGKTLFSLAERLGIPDTAVFTPALQDALFDHLVRTTLGGRSSVAGKRSVLRGVWEGFKNVSDAELDAAIRTFETGSPVSIEAAVTTGVGANAFAIFDPQVGTLAANDYAPAEGTGGVSTSGIQSVAIAPEMAQALMTEFNLSEEMVRVIQYLTSVEQGKLSQEGKEILTNLGIDAEGVAAKLEEGTK